MKYQAKIFTDQGKILIIPLMGTSRQEIRLEIESSPYYKSSFVFTGGECPIWYKNEFKTIPAIIVSAVSPTPASDYEEWEKRNQALLREKSAENRRIHRKSLNEKYLRRKAFEDKWLHLNKGGNHGSRNF